LAVAVLALAVGCVGGPQDYGPVPPRHTNGHAVFVEGCQECHGLPGPKRHTDAEWIPVLEKMAKKAALTEDDAAAITAFLEALTGDQPQVTYPILPPSTADTPPPQP